MRDGVLDAAATRAELDAQLWDLARDLVAIACEQREVDRLATHAGPTAGAALAAHHTALAEAHEVAEARVAALQAYAGQVAELDAEHRDAECAALAVARETSALDLASRRSASEASLERLNELSAQLTVPRQRIAEEMLALREAAAALDALLATPPATPPGRSPERGHDLATA